jgi:hypothetical protein
MKIQGKIWGKTQDIFKNSNFELHRIEAKKGGFETDYDLVDETIISTREMTIAKPGTYHRFEALEDTICYEIYWVELDSNDIERENVGGKAT